MRYLILRLKRFCGFAVGFVFFLSGLLKLMDPTGAELVMKEYFSFLHLGFLEVTAKAFGIALAFTETVIGAALVTGVWKKVIAATAVGMQGFFTMLTAILVIFKPDMDCGCFGEAINLTHGQTFTKNIILLGLLLTYYIPAKHLAQTQKKKYVSFSVVCISAAAFALYSMLFIPMADFTDFKPGTLINTSTDTADSYEASFIYSKDGKEESFSLEDLPDTTWTFVRTETTDTRKNKGTAATVSISDRKGEYADSLLASGKVIVISIYEDDLSEKDINRLNSFIRNAHDAGFTPIVLSSENIQGIDSPTYLCDYKTLITLNRSNGGATYINNGFIIRKWAKRALPDPKGLAMLSEEDPTDTFIGRDTGTSLAFQGFLLYVFAVMLLL